MCVCGVGGRSMTMHIDTQRSGGRERERGSQCKDLEENQQPVVSVVAGGSMTISVTRASRG